MNNNEFWIKQYNPSEPRQTAESSSTLATAGSLPPPTKNLQGQAFQAFQIAVCL